MLNWKGFSILLRGVSFTELLCARRVEEGVDLNCDRKDLPFNAETEGTHHWTLSLAVAGLRNYFDASKHWTRFIEAQVSPMTCAVPCTTPRKAIRNCVWPPPRRTGTNTPCVKAHLLPLDSAQQMSHFSHKKESLWYNESPMNTDGPTRHG